MFNFNLGNTAIAKSLVALATGLGFQASPYYTGPQLAVYLRDWSVMVDLDNLYISVSDPIGGQALKICQNVHELEDEYLNLIHGIVFDGQVCLATSTL